MRERGGTCATGGHYLRTANSALKPRPPSALRRLRAALSFHEEAAEGRRKQKLDLRHLVLDERQINHKSNTKPTRQKHSLRTKQVRVIGTAHHGFSGSLSDSTTAASSSPPVFPGHFFLVQTESQSGKTLQEQVIGQFALHT